MTEPGPGSVAVRTWKRVGTRFLPFADVASEELPFSRLMRLTLFQISVGMVQTLFVGTLNRVMIVELAVPASLVAAMLAIPLLAAPFRALVGFRSDTHRSILGWKRVPYLWFGTVLQFGGLAIMPFALLVLSEAPITGKVWIGNIGSALAFLLVGAGAHTTQTAGLALATDVVREDKRPRVIALMYLMMLVGTLISAFILEFLLRDFTQIKLVQVIQGTAVFTVACNMLSLWKQEPRRRGVVPYAKGERRPMFREAWRTFAAGGQAVRLLVVSGLGFFAFNLQDVLLEPYGGEILGMTVSQTTLLTGIMAVGAVLAFSLAAAMLGRRVDPIRLSAAGVMVGIVGFVVVTMSSAAHLAGVFRFGTLLIGFAEGLFGVGTLSFAMRLRDPSQHGIALGAWGAVFATAEGSSFALAGVMKDWLSGLVAQGALGPVASTPATPYSAVYLLEVVILFATLVAMGPLVRRRAATVEREEPVGVSTFGLADIPA
jgi:BCD family chlorophyll transporter-like MFS transporter